MRHYRYDVMVVKKFLDKGLGMEDRYATTIKEQWGKMGLSVDYSRERSLLILSKAVRKIFVDLYKKGWSTVVSFIINWDQQLAQPF